MYSDAAICHKRIGAGNPDRNLKIYKKMIANGKTLEPHQQYYYGCELYYHGLYEEAVSIFEQFLASLDGWIENKTEACSILADCCYKLNQEQSALMALLRSLSFDLPRAELCCDIGKHFLEHGNYQNAIYWYETALDTKRNDRTGGFILPDCYDYIPYLQLCVCYDKIGDYQRGNRYKVGISRGNRYEVGVLLNCVIIVKGYQGQCERDWLFLFCLKF